MENVPCNLILTRGDEPIKRFEPRKAIVENNQTNSRQYQSMKYSNIEFKQLNVVKEENKDNHQNRSKQLEQRKAELRTLSPYEANLNWRYKRRDRTPLTDTSNSYKVQLSNAPNHHRNNSEVRHLFVLGILNSYSSNIQMIVRINFIKRRANEEYN